MTATLRSLLPALGSALLAALSLAASAPQSAPPAPPATGGVTLVELDGELDAGALSLLRRAAAGARERSDVLLVEMNTPGGSVETMWRIAGALDDARADGTTTACWVRQHALSAGALVAITCDKLFMRSSATIGSATPILSLPAGLPGIAPVEEKFQSALRADFRAHFARRGPFGALGEAMVDADAHVREVRVGSQRLYLSETEFDDKNQRGEIDQVVRTVSPAGELLNLTGSEAFELGLVDGIKETLEDVIATVHRRGTEPTRLLRSQSEAFASWVDRYWMLLVFGGLVLAYMEIKAPGFGVPGIASIACFTLFLTGRYMAGLADWVQILLVALGVALLAVELFLMPGTIWAGIAGAVCLVVGLVWANLGSGAGIASPTGRELLLDSLFVTAMTGVAALVGMYGLSLVLPRTPLLGRMVQTPTESWRAPSAAQESARPGALGRALTDLRPVGKVVLDGGGAAELEARSSGTALARGARVRVVEVQGNRLVVEAEE